MVKIIGIYKIINPKGKIYIGQSTNIKNRKRVYRFFKSYVNSIGPIIYNSLKKYGFENHNFEVVFCTQKDTDKELEHFIIQTFNPKLNMVKEYNSTAKDKFWVNDGIKEFQIYANQIDGYKGIHKGRLINPFKKT